MIKRAGALLLFIAALTGSTSWAATIYMSPSGNDSNSGTTGSRKLTLNGAVSAAGATGTVIVGAGSYSGSLNIFNDTNMSTGSVAGTLTIQAELLGGCTFTAGIAMRDSTTPLQSHITVDGLTFIDSGQKQIYGDHIRFVNCGFDGGPGSGNTVNTVVGGNNNGSNLTRFVTIERCWFWGLGGRYKLLVFNAENIILRQIVIRDDGGWNDSPNTGNPEACFALYNSSACAVQDMHLIDSSGNYYEYQQAAYFIHNPGAVPDHLLQGNRINGLFIYNTKAVGLRSDAATSTDNLYQNLAIVNSQDFGASWGSNSNSSATVIGAMFMRHNMAMTATPSSGGVGFFSTGKITIHEVTVSSYTTGSDFQGVTVSSFCSFNNSGTTSGGKTYDPSLNGQTYPFRIEAGSNLSTAGTSGATIGATMTTQIGTLGTFWGDSGYLTDSGLALFPLSNEALIKNNFCGIASSTRTDGLCATTGTLSTYEWQVLGSTINLYGVDTSSPGAPTNLSTSAVTTASFNFLITASTDDVGVTDYRMDVSTDNFSTFSGGYNDTSMGTGITGSVTGLTASTTYSWRMRAKDAAGNTSNQSATASVTTATPASVSMSRGMNLSGTATLNIGGGRITVP